MGVEAIIDRNDNIRDEVKGIIKDTFSDIFKFMGERNFKRWLVKKHIPKVARDTIYEIATSDSDTYLKEHENVSGYHRAPTNTKKREIVLRKGIGDNKKTISHETLHAFANGLGGFNRFVGEGITEFLAKTIYNKDNYAYPNNVDTVELLYKMYGDSIMRDYLMQTGDRFFENIALKAASRRQDFRYL